MLISRRHALALALTVLAALPGPPAVADDDPPTKGQAGARALLEKAARHQSEEPWTRAPRSLHGSFYGTIQTQEGSGNVTVERWYTRSPERIVTRHTESVTGTRYTVGHDGRTAWYRNDATGEVVIYSEDPERFAVDIELVEEQRRLTRLLMDAVVLDALIPRLETIQRGRASNHTDIEGVPHRVWYVSAETVDDLYPPSPDAPPPTPDDPPPMLRLTIDNQHFDIISAPCAGEGDVQLAVREHRVGEIDPHQRRDADDADLYGKYADELRPQASAFQTVPRGSGWQRRLGAGCLRYVC